MGKFNAIARQYRADQRAKIVRPIDFDAAPWLWLDDANAERLRAYKKRRREYENPALRRGSDQPITDDFILAHDEESVTRIYIIVMIHAIILLFLAAAN